MSLAVVTVATANVLPELKLWLASVKKYVSDAVYIVTAIPAAELPGATTIPFSEPFDFVRMCWQRTHALRTALKDHDAALYADTDILFLQQWQPCMPKNKVTLSKHYCNEWTHSNYGYYNSGYVGVTRDTLDFCDWWEAQPQWKPGAYGEQQCLDNWDAARRALFPEQHNVGWWRLNNKEESAKFELKLTNGVIEYNGAPLTSIHSHLMTVGFTPLNLKLAWNFNEKLFELLELSKQYNDFLRLAQPRNVATPARYEGHRSNEIVKQHRQRRALQVQPRIIRRFPT
jgi:hypothetical protein